MMSHHKSLFQCFFAVNYPQYVGKVLQKLFRLDTEILSGDVDMPRFACKYVVGWFYTKRIWFFRLLWPFPKTTPAGLVQDTLMISIRYRYSYNKTEFESQFVHQLVLSNTTDSIQCLKQKTAKIISNAKSYRKSVRGK